MPPNDPVEHPAHYTQHPSGVECVQITEHMNFCLGNALKYIWRAGLKGSAVEDLKKAIFYIEREIALMRSANSKRYTERKIALTKESSFIDPLDPN